MILSIWFIQKFSLGETVHFCFVYLLSFIGNTKNSPKQMSYILFHLALVYDLDVKKWTRTYMCIYILFISYVLSVQPAFLSMIRIYLLSI